MVAVVTGEFPVPVWNSMCFVACSTCL